MKKEIHIEEVKKIEAEILKYFTIYCKEHNLCCYLAFGTLIGAIRHQGFIPWDDDIDVVMPRPDYDKLLTLAKNGIGEHIKILTKENCSNYVYPFAKAIDDRTILIEKSVGKKHPIGIYIDIFPMDGIPDRPIKRKFWFAKIKFIRKLTHFSYALHIKGRKWYTSVIRAILVPLCRSIGTKFFLDRLEHVIKKYPYEKSKFIASVAWKKKMIAIDKENFTKPINVTFENEQYEAPSNYHEFLTKDYGNYMKLPPKEERVSHHYYNAYWKQEGVK